MRRKHLGLTLILEAAHHVNPRASWEGQDHSRVACRLAQSQVSNTWVMWLELVWNLLSNLHRTPLPERNRETIPAIKEEILGQGYLQVLSSRTPGWSLKAIL